MEGEKDIMEGFYDVIVELPVAIEDDDGNVVNKGRKYKESNLDKLVEEIIRDGGVVESAVLVFYDKPMEIIGKTEMIRDLVKDRRS